MASATSPARWSIRRTDGHVWEEIGIRTRTRGRLLVGVSCGLALLARTGPAAVMGGPVSGRKKLIAFATNAHAASPAHFRRHAAEMERRVPLDGLIIRVYPDITIILYPHTGWRVALDYELLGPFVDGLLEGLGPRATLVDAGQAYQLRTYGQFLDLREKGRKRGLERTSVPDLYRKVQWGIGLWVDHEARAGGPYDGWRTDPKEVHKNYRPPQELGHTLHNALTVSDRYVWLYVWHRAAWWAPDRPAPPMCPLCPHEEGIFPHGYADALANFRGPHPIDWSPARREKIFRPEDLAETGRNILVNGDLEKWILPDQSPPAWSLGGQGPAVARDEKNARSGACSVRLTTVLPKGHVFLDQRIEAGDRAGRTITFGAWVKDDRDLAHVQILDFAADGHESSRMASEWNDDTGWRFLTATKTIRKDATLIVFRLGAHTVEGLAVWWDDGQAVVTE